MLPPRFETLTPATLNLAGSAVLGTTVPIELTRVWPIEEIFVTFTVTAGATGPTLAGCDNILGLVKNFTLEVNDGVQPRNLINTSGVGLLEYASQVGLNLDRATLATVALSQGATIPNNQIFRLTYRIPVVHPMIAEPLRTRMLMPCHTWSQNLNLKITFEQAANMYSAGTLAGIATEILIVRRQMDSATTDSIIKTGGFINFDLIETPYTVPVGSGGVARFKIPSPGSYAGLLIRTYKGAATVVRDTIDAVTTPGAETLWDIESGQVVLRQFRMRTLQMINDLSRVANGVNQTYSPNFGGAVAAGTSYQPAASVYLDYLGDNLGSDANELGSVLDVNIPQKSGLIMELVGATSAPVTNGHQLLILGHRWYGDLSRWQAVQT